MGSPILAPVVALVLWSLVVLLWVMVTRMPALKEKGIDVMKVVGGRPGGLDGVLPDSVQWKAHNYIHLMEQPTLFYAICLALALAGAGDGLNAQLAWVYVGLRVAHSLVQGTFNAIRVRFPLFLLSSIALIWLAVNAALVVF